MSYGISVFNGIYNNIDPQALGGNVFVRTISTAAGSGGTYDIQGVTSHTFLRIYYVNAGSHSVSLSTVSNTARITIAPVGAYIPADTILAVFTTQTVEPNYGVATTNNAGDRIVSTLYPVPKYQGKVTFSTTPTYSVSPIGSTHNVRYHQTTTALGGFTKRLVLWTLPEQVSDVWYFGTDYISESVGGSTIQLGVLVPKTGGTYILPEALIFSLEGYSATSDNYGLRIYNNGGGLNFDSGSQHMTIRSYTGVAYGDSQYVESNSYLSQTTTATQIPDYRFEQYIGIINSDSSDYYSYRGAVKRVGSTLYSKRFLVFKSLEDLFINSSDEYGSSSNTVLLIDATQLGAGSSGSGTVTGSTPTYSIASTSSSVNEGTSVAFNITTTNVPNGTVLYWTLSRPEDFGTSSGSVVINNEAASFSVTPTADSATEGPETFTASVRTGSTSGTIVATSASVTIGDTSTAPATYSVSPNVTSVNEGGSVTFTVTTSSVPTGTTLYWTASRPEDVSPGSGNFTINSNSGSFSVQISADQLTEGSETFTVSVRTGSTSGTVVATSQSITINDTSTAPTVSYSISPAASSVDEGSSLTFYVTTTAVPNGTTLYWTVTNSGDFSPSSGSFTIQSGSGSFVVFPVADSTTEGSETFTASVRTGSTSGTIVATSSSVTINDTSTTAPPPTYNFATGFDIPVSVSDTINGYAALDLLIEPDGSARVSDHNGIIQSGPYAWVDPTSVTSQYTFYVRVTRIQVSGEQYGAASGSTGWLAINTTRGASVYALSSNITLRTVSARYLIEFSDNASTVGGSGYFTLTASTSFNFN